jgi:hypothetical protein
LTLTRLTVTRSSLQTPTRSRLRFAALAPLASAIVVVGLPNVARRATDEPAVVKHTVSPVHSPTMFVCVA